MCTHSARRTSPPACTRGCWHPPFLLGRYRSLARCVAAGMQEAAPCNEQPTHAAAAPDVAPDVAEAAAAASFELPMHPLQPLPVAPAPPAECEEDASGARSDDDGFEFGSDASDSSSSWTSSDEETGAPLTSASLPAWLARRGAGGRCAAAAAFAVPSLTAPRCIVTWMTKTTRHPHAQRLLPSRWCVHCACIAQSP